MHRTQIYFEEPLFEQIRMEAKRMGLSISAYIRDVVQRDLTQKRSRQFTEDFSEFAGMWKDSDITQQTLREKAW